MTGVDRFASDRLNPILVREIQQALAGRGFALLLIAAISGVLILTLFVALSPQAADLDERGGLGFAGAMVCLTPIAMFLVPAQAFQSMRAEVQGGLAEQLAMTRLRPRSIVVGRIWAAQIQMLLFVSVFAPFLALSWLLRGIDVPTIAAGIVLVCLLNVVSSAFAIAGGAICFNRVAQGLAQAVVTLTLVFATMPMMAVMVELPRELANATSGTEFWEILGAMVLGAVLAVALCVTVGSAALGHAYENRSTPFRAWLVAVIGIVTAYSWLTWPTSVMLRDLPEMIFAVVGFGTPIWLWAVCETHTLSPRVRTRVPRNPFLAVLAAPWLPGGHRGSLFVLMVSAVGLGLAVGLPALSGVPVPSRIEDRVVLAFGYVLAYAALARLFRRRFGPSPKGSRRALVLTLTVLAIATLLPMLFGLQGGGMSISPFACLSPVWMLVFDGRSPPISDAAAWTFVAVAGVFLLLDGIRGLREVLAASAARRQLAS